MAIDPIDPSAVENGQRIIEIIVAKLYQDFKRKLETLTEEKYGQKTEDIMNAFNDIMRALRVIRHPDTILKESFAGKDMMFERLEELGTISNLKSRMASLVKDLLQLNFSNQTGDDFLLLVIDDADLHIDSGIQLLEDLRKYFRIPQLIILMGLRLEQLHSNISREVFKTIRRISEYGGI